MTILVTGGAGYIGAHMALALLDRGEAVVILDDLSTGAEWMVPGQARFVRGDVADAELVGRLIREHGIMEIAHFAARIVVPESVSDPLGYYLANTVKTRALLETAVRGGVERFVFSSTAAVYGEPQTVPIPEDLPLAPVNPYGRSKLMSEWMLRDAGAAHGLKVAILRYFNVAGADPGGRAGQAGPNATHLIKVAAEAALGKRTGLDMYGDDYPTPDGTCVRDYVQVSDLADAHLVALDRLRAGETALTLNCGYGRGFSVREVVDVVRRVSGVEFPVAQKPRRAGDPAALVASPERLRALGWAPRHDELDAIVAQALDWERRLAARNAA